MLEIQLTTDQIESLKEFLPKVQREHKEVYKNSGVPKFEKVYEMERQLYNTVESLFPTGVDFLSIEHNGVLNNHLANELHIDFDKAMRKSGNYWTIVWYFSDNTDSPLIIVDEVGKHLRIDPKCGKVVAFPSSTFHGVPVCAANDWRSSIVAIVKIKHNKAR